MDAFRLLGAYIGRLTGLQYAIIEGKTGIALDIVDVTFQQDIDIAFGDKNTALHLAAFLNDGDVVRSLIERGADPNIRNGKGFRPVDLCNDPEVLSIISTN